MFVNVEMYLECGKFGEKYSVNVEIEDNEFIEKVFDVLAKEENFDEWLENFIENQRLQDYIIEDNYLEGLTDDDRYYTDKLAEQFHDWDDVKFFVKEHRLEEELYSECDYLNYEDLFGLEAITQIMDD